MKYFDTLNDIENNIRRRSLAAEPELITLCEVGIDLLLECGEIITNHDKPISGNISEHNSSNFFVARFLVTMPAMTSWCLKATLAGHYTIAGILLRPLLESQISLFFYMEFPNDAHQLMHSYLIEDTDKRWEKSPKSIKYFDPKPATKLKRLQMDQNHIVYKNWEDLNKYAAHPVAVVPSLFAKQGGGIAVEPFFSSSGLRIILNYLVNSIGFTLATLISNYTYLADSNSSWYRRLQEEYKIDLANDKISGE